MEDTLEISKYSVTEKLFNRGVNSNGPIHILVRQGNEHIKEVVGVYYQRYPRNRLYFQELKCDVG